MERPKVIIINGVGSVGKTTTIRALQAITLRPMLHVAMDSFLSMLPESLFGHPDGLTFEACTDSGRPSVAIRSGTVLDQAMRGMRHAVSAMAAQGNDLIVDEVIIGTEAVEEYQALLAPFEVRWVGLFASLEVLEQRERARGDRQIGLARWQYTRVHRAVVYDLEIDTNATPPRDNARIIRDAFGL